MSTHSTSPRLVDGFKLAEEIHCGQQRKKTGAPTLSHLMSVAALVMENGGNEDQAIAALLHDGPEDCGGQPVLDRIRDRFGDRVAAIVEDCTDTLETEKPPWESRKRQYLAHLRDVSDESLLVSISDKVHNARSILEGYRQEGEALWSRFTGTREQTLWYYDSLLEIFQQRLTPQFEGLVLELQRVLESLRARIQVETEGRAAP